MKEGWELLTIKECCDILDSRRKPITKSKRESGTIPYYGATGLLDYVKDYIFNEPLVLLGEDGAKWGAGECSAYRIEGKSWVNNHAHALRPKRDIVNDYWLIYFLNYSNLQSYITGVTVPKLNQEKMCSITLPVPPLSEQQRIVDYLDAAFAKIDAMKANAEKSLNEAKALFQASLKEMLEPKEGWEEKKIKDIGFVIAGTTPNTNVAEYWNGNLCWISPAELDGSHYLYDSRKKITEAAVKAKSLRLLPEGTVILSSRAPIGKVVINKIPTYCNQGFKCVVCGKEVYNEFLYWWFWGKTEYLNSLGTGATFKEISKKVVEEILIPVPPLSEQQRIVATLDALKSKVDRLQANFEKISQECDALKQALLREVFEG